MNTNSARRRNYVREIDPYVSSCQDLKVWVLRELYDNLPCFRRVRENRKPTKRTEVLRLRIGGNHYQSGNGRFTNVTKAIDRPMCWSDGTMQCNLGQFWNGWSTVRSKNAEDRHGIVRMSFQFPHSVKKMLRQPARGNRVGQKGKNFSWKTTVHIERNTASQSLKVVRAEHIYRRVPLIHHGCIRSVSSRRFKPLSKCAAMIFRFTASIKKDC